MSERIRCFAWLALAAVALSVAACGGTSPTGPSPVGPPPSVDPLLAPANRVVIVSIDGLRPDALQRAGAPNVMALAARGAYTWQGRSILPSTTLPAHVSMLSGFPPEVHGVTWDEYQPWRGRIPVPTLFTAAQAQGRRTAMVVGKEKFGHFRDLGACDIFVLAGRGDADVAAEAARLIQSDVDLLFVHLPEVDVAGHASTWMSESYLASVRRADDAVGRIVAALPAESTLILTADHGGHVTGHGTDDVQDMTIPWIVVGPTTVIGRQLSTPVRTVDTAATAAYVLGITLPGGTTGVPVREAFHRPPAPAVAGAMPLALDPFGGVRAGLPARP